MVKPGRACPEDLNRRSLVYFRQPRISVGLSVIFGVRSARTRGREIILAVANLSSSPYGAINRPHRHAASMW